MVIHHAQRERRWDDAGQTELGWPWALSAAMGRGVTLWDVIILESTGILDHAVDVGHVHGQVELHHQVGAELLQLFARVDGLRAVKIVWGAEGLGQRSRRGNAEGPGRRYERRRFKQWGQDGAHIG
jgi:hypothetical protein